MGNGILALKGDSPELAKETASVPRGKRVTKVALSNFFEEEFFEDLVNTNVKSCQLEN